ncbi:hypothetical protein JKG68_27250 [Microvirga aerilata]|uniref:Uncharacterized protein n=1 Tax=Microvirga aerilata TaxID=670292 RepID=A0A936ZMX0_9HYPH|nr:hypothetical protein [Microvirga aerilata]MBL0407619.1 hypothetical protein [Microvirga aerilata]
MTADNDSTNVGTVVSITVWVAGANMHEASQRRQAVDTHLSGPSVTYVGGGFGRFFYDLWVVQSGRNPLAMQGEWIADSQFEFAARAFTPEELVDLTRQVEADLKQALDFPVAVEIKLVQPDDETGAENVHDPETFIDPDGKLLVVLTEREHAHLLAALRRVQASGGLEGVPEAEIAENGENWKTMTVEELNELGDRFNGQGIIAHNVRL